MGIHAMHVQLSAFVLVHLVTAAIAAPACDWGKILRLPTFTSSYLIDQSAAVHVNLTIPITVTHSSPSCPMATFRKSIGRTYQTIDNLSVKGSFSGIPMEIPSSTYTSGDWRFVQLHLPRAVAIGETFTALITYHLKAQQMGKPPLTRDCNHPNSLIFEESTSNQWVSPQIVGEYRYQMQLCTGIDHVVQPQPQSQQTATDPNNCPGIRYTWSRNRPSNGFRAELKLGATPAGGWIEAFPVAPCAEDSDDEEPFRMILLVTFGSLLGTCLVFAVVVFCVLHDSCSARRPSTDLAEATICTMEESELPRPSICTVPVGAPASPPSYGASNREGQPGATVLIPLEGLWTVHHDAATGQPYWCCTRTGQTTWDPPAVLPVNTYGGVPLRVKGDSA